MELDSQSANLSARALLTDERKEVSILSSDIGGYMTLTEKMDADSVAAMLNEYFASMVEALFKSKQGREENIQSACIGNRIVAVFGSPKPLEDHAWIALQTACQMYEQLAILNARRENANQPEIRIGIGINSDSVFNSNISANKGMDFMAIGAAVNMSYRLEGVCKLYGCNIVISENTYKSCAERIWVRELDKIRIQGTNAPITIYEFLGLRSDAISEQKQRVLDHYYKGREYYLNRKFALAIGEFATVREIDSNDRASTIQLKRCQHWLKTPPPEDWDGSWLLTPN